MGTADNKFGINIESLDEVVEKAMQLSNIHLKGLHFHIGSQITEMKPFAMLCNTVNVLIDRYEQQGIHFELINVGGGLGIDYSSPDQHPLPDFQAYFDTFKNRLKPRPGQMIHFELGRAIVGMCGSLISRVVYVKENRDKKFVILDAGMTDLIRPALYDAYHQVQNLSAAQGDLETYDIVEAEHGSLIAFFKTLSCDESSTECTHDTCDVGTDCFTSCDIFKCS